MVYAILGMGFIPVAIFRYRMAVSNANRLLPMQVVGPHQDDHPESVAISDPPTKTNTTSHDITPSSGRDSSSNLPLHGPVHTVLRESFVTAGSVVAGATVFVGLVEIALLVLILRV